MDSQDPSLPGCATRFTHAINKLYIVEPYKLTRELYMAKTVQFTVAGLNSVHSIGRT